MTTFGLARVRAHRLYYGWLIVGAGMAIQALQGALLTSAYGAYVALLQVEYGWSKAVLSGAFSMQQMESGLLGPFQGWLIDRFGPRAVMRFGMVLLGGGFMLFSRLDSIATFYASFLVVAIGFSLSGFFPTSVAIINWFTRHRATAMGVMSTGMGIGGLLVPGVAWSMAAYGWRATAFASGVVIVVVGLPLVQVMRHRPEEYGYLPDGEACEAVPDGGTLSAEAEASAGGPSGQSNDFTLQQALRTSAFWYVSFGHAGALLVVSAVTVHLVIYLKESLGYSVAEGAAVVALMTGMSMIGQLAGGLLGDRFSKRLLAAGCMLGHALALLVLAFATALWMVVLFAVVQGLAWGIRGPLMQSIRADYFGRRAFGTIMGASSTIVTLGSVSGSLFAGVMADRFGTYRTGFIVLATLAGLGSVLWVLARAPALLYRIHSD